MIENYYLENNQSTNYEEYVKHIELYGLGSLNITESDIKELITRIEEYSGVGKIRPFELNIHEIFLEKSDGEYNSFKKFEYLESFLKTKFKLEADEIKMLKEYTKILDARLVKVFKHAIDNKCSIMIDAEQTYLQHHFDYIAAYVFKIYNKEHSILSTTLQCYLANQIQRLDKLHDFCREYNLKIGVKLVRGAYMFEENKLAEDLGIPSPICGSLEETNDNYNNSLAKLFEMVREEEKVRNYFYFFINFIYFFRYALQAIIWVLLYLPKTL